MGGASVIGADRAPWAIVLRSGCGGADRVLSTGTGAHWSAAMDRELALLPGAWGHRVEALFEGDADRAMHALTMRDGWMPLGERG